MKTISIIGIVAASIALVLFIAWMVKKSRTGTDVKTGVANDKIQKAAEAIGIPKKVAEEVAKAPDSEAAARSIGVPPVLATAVANGIALTAEDIVNVSYSPNDRRIILFTNTASGCPAGSTQVPITTGGYGCLANSN